MGAKDKSNEIHLSRIYQAPLKIVWEAWTDPSQVAQWWGPRGFSLTTHSKALKTGGHWHYTMHGPDGVDYPNRTHYLEVEKFKKLVYDHGANESQPPLFRVTVKFNEVQGKTHMDLCMSLSTPEAAAATRQFIKKAGGEATWDRLAEYLAKSSANKEQFVINRSFAANQTQLFDMWAQPQHFSKWLAPTGFNMELLRADIKPGGELFYRISNGKDVTMHGKIHYLAINRPNSMLYTQQFCDADEKPARHPLAPTWPAIMLTQVDFTAESDSQTRITVTWEPHGDITPQELQTFIQGRTGMTQGWTGSFDKLDQYLLG